MVDIFNGILFNIQWILFNRYIQWNIIQWIQYHSHSISECEWTHSAIKNNEIMPFANTWIELESLMLSEISQSEKHKYNMISLICGI